jgi:FMN phosphatase YigB (HAD superfamily)
MSKEILSDVDGCMVVWKNEFNNFMERHGFENVVERDNNIHPWLYRDDVYEIEDLYGISKQQADFMVDMFNESIHLGHLPPLKDAIKYIRKLHEEHGYVFHCITACGTHHRVHDLRLKNLNDLFGSNVIKRLVCTESSRAKRPILEEYKDSRLYWVEDKVSNAIMGHELGLRSILINHSYNLNYIEHPFDEPQYLRVNNWKQIYDIVVDSE